MSSSSLDDVLLKKVDLLAKEEVATGKVVSAQTAQIGVVDALKVKYSGLIKTMKTFFTSPWGIAITTATAAMTIGVAVWDEYNTSTKEAQEHLEQVTGELSELQSEIDSLNSELETTGQKIDEILRKDTIELADEEELKKLQAQNEELERELRIKTSLEKLKRKEASDAAKESLESTPGKGDLFTRNGTRVISKDGVGQAYGVYDADRNRIEASKDYIAEIQILNKKIAELRSQQSMLVPGSEEYNEIERDITGYYQYLLDENRAQLDQYIDELSDEDDKLVEGLDENTDALLKELQELYDLYSKLDIPDISAASVEERLYDKFSNGVRSDAQSNNNLYIPTSVINEQADVALNQWIESLSDEDKKLMLECDLDDASLDELKEWLAQQKIEVKVETKFSISEAEATALSEYQSKIDSIGSSLSNLGDLTSSDITKLMTDFREYAYIFDEFGVTGEQGVGNLGGALEALANKIREATLEALKDCPQMSDAVNQMFDDIISHPNGNPAKIRKEFNELNDVYDDVSNGMTMNMNEATKLINKYPDLADAIKIVGDEYSFEEDALISLINSKATELNKASSYEYQHTVNTLKDVDARIAAYETEYIARKALSGDFDNLLSNPKEIAFGQSGDIHDPIYQQLLNQRAELQELIAQLEEDIRKGKVSTSEFSEEIDWAARSVEVLEDNLSDLERTFDNAKGYDAQKAAIQGVIGALEDLQEGYRQSEIMYSSMYDHMFRKGILAEQGIAEKVRSKIESGELFSIEQFESSEILPEGVDESIKEQIYNAIQEAIDLWNKKNDAGDNYIQIGVDIDAKKLEDLQLDADKFSAIRENLETELDGSLSDKRRLEILEDPDGLKKAINDEYNALIKVAEAENDAYEVAKLKLSQKQALADVDQQRLDLIREIDEAEISRLERNRTEIQNQIDLNGGKGTAEQYKELISYQKEIAKERTADLEREKKLLLEIEVNIGKNSDAYREQEQKVNDIEDALADCTKEIKDMRKAILDIALDALDDAIDDLNDELESTEEEMEEIEKISEIMQNYYERQIQEQERLKDAVQDEIDALNEANDKRKRALDLQKAQYDLERAHNQRVKKVYKGEGQGFIYEADQDNIRSAQETISDLEHDEAIAKLEEKIERYDKIIEKLERKKEEWANTTNLTDEEIDDFIDSMGGEDNLLDKEDGLLTKSKDKYSQVNQYKEELQDAAEFLEEMKERIAGYVEDYEWGAETFNTTLGLISADVMQYTDLLKLSEEETSSKYIDMMNTILEKFGIMEDAVAAGWQTLTDEAGKTGENVTDGMTPDATPTEDAVGEIIDDVKNANEENKTSTENANNAIQSDTEQTYGSVTDTLKTELSEQKSATETFKEEMIGIFQTMCSAFITEVSNAFNTMDGEIVSVASSISEKIQQIVDDAYSSVNDLKDAVTEAEETIEDFGGANITITGGGGHGFTMKQLAEYHTGIENGLVGEKNAGEGLKKVALRKLEPDEIPALLKLDEAVLTQLQQHNVMSNIGTAFRAGVNTAVIKNNSSTPVVQNITLTLPNVTNESGYNRLVQELQGLQLDALQFAKKR